MSILAEMKWFVPKIDIYFDCENYNSDHCLNKYTENIGLDGVCVYTKDEVSQSPTASQLIFHNWSAYWLSVHSHDGRSGMQRLENEKNDCFYVLDYNLLKIEIIGLF